MHSPVSGVTTATFSDAVLAPFRLSSQLALSSAMPGGCAVGGPSVPVGAPPPATSFAFAKHFFGSKHDAASSAEPIDAASNSGSEFGSTKASLHSPSIQVSSGFAQLGTNTVGSNVSAPASAPPLLLF